MTVVDPWASKQDVRQEYGIELTGLTEVCDADCVIVAVARDVFRDLPLDFLKGLYKKELADEEKILLDVKGIYSFRDLDASGMRYWRL